MKLIKKVSKRRVRRAYRIRNQVKISGRLRLSVFRSNRHIYAQIIDDETGNTLVACNSMEGSIAGAGQYAGNIESAKKVGATLAARAKEKGIEEIAFDRGSNRYHGRVKALAEAAREGGLDF